MARTLSNAKLLVVSFADALSPSVSRRGYAAAGAAQGSVSGGRGGSRSGIMEKMEIRAAMKEESSSGSGAAAASAWSPDPVTGYYRPQNCAAEIDPVELRNMLLNHKASAL